MSSAMNHRKRSHRSESYTKGALSAQSRSNYIKQDMSKQRKTLAERLKAFFHRPKTHDTDTHK